jgi:TonB family protein
LAAVLANAPAQSVAIASGNPRLAAAMTQAAPISASAPAANIVSKPSDTRSKVPSVAEPAAPDVYEPVRVQIAQPHIDRMSFAGNTQVRDIAQTRALPLTAVMTDAATVAAAELPARLHVVPPVYPPRAMSAHVEGSVQLEFSVDADGAVQNIQVLHAQPAGVFDDAAQAALSQWRFERSAAADANARYTQNFAFTLAAGKGNSAKCQQVIGSLICRHLDE